MATGAEKAGDAVASTLLVAMARAHRVQSIKLRAEAGGFGVTGCCLSYDDGR